MLLTKKDKIEKVKHGLSSLLQFENHKYLG